MGVRQTKQPAATTPGYTSRLLYPFSAIAGQLEMKLALILNVIDPQIGGVLIMGHRGTGKSSAVRALADLLPLIWVVRDCPYRCDPSDIGNLCLECNEKLARNEKLIRERQTVPVVDLPLGATEDRVCGTIDIERALRDGWKTFEPGLLARANRGFLYVDEVNLLEDHLVDLLLDVSVTGVNRVERESISIEHPAKFVLIGSGNPEEGELRPQLLDRFGLHVEVETEQDPERRLEVLERHQLFATDPENFLASFRPQQIELQKRINRARRNMGRVKLDQPLLRQIAQLSSELKVDGHRGELTIARAVKAIAAFEGRSRATEQDIRRVAPMALQHRLRRDPLEERGASRLIQEALDKVFTTQRPGKQTSGNNESGNEPSSELSPDKESLTDPSTFKRQVGVYPFQKPDGTSNPDRHSANKISSSLENSPDAVSQPARESRPPKLSLKDRSQLDRSFKDSGHPSDRGLAHGPDSSRGRYVRAVVRRMPASRIAMDATLRAVAATNGTTNPLRVPSDSLRFKHFTRRRGSLFVFAIDTSGSMAAKRIDQAKSAALGLLRQSYLRRDQVAIMTFRGTSAEVVLPPSRSILRARRVLDSLPVGGSTPMSAALVCALKVAKRQKNQKVVLLLFTDGRANVSLEGNGCNRAERLESIKNETRFLGAELRKAGVTTVVVETENGFWLTGGARELAERLRAQLFEVGDTVGRKKTVMLKEAAS